MHKTIKNTSIYLSQILISGVILIISTPIIAYQLAPEVFGVFVLVQVYIGVGVGIANFGLIVGYERNFFVYENNAKQSAQLLYSVISFVSFNLLLILIPLIIWQSELVLLISENAKPELLSIIFIGSAFNALAQYHLTYLKNRGLARSFVFFMLLQAISNFLLIISLLFLTSLGVLSLAYAWLISNTLLMLGLFVNYYKKLPPSINFNLLKIMLKISLPLTPKVFLGVLNTQFDKIMLGLIGSTSLVGIYQIGQTLALTTFQFTTGLGRVFQPELYRKLFANRHLDNKLEINNYMLPFFFISTLFALGLALFSKEIIIILFPISYLGAVNVITILSVYYALSFFGKITGNQLIYAKKTIISMFLTPIGIIINVALNIPFITYWGIVGAAVATTITGIIMTIIGFILAQKYAHITWQWHKINILHSLFLLGASWALIDYNNVTDISYIWAILIKFCLLGLYIIVGFKLNIISKTMLYSLKKTNNA